jgi:hypothetical protein
MMDQIEAGASRLLERLGAAERTDHTGRAQR